MSFSCHSCRLQNLNAALTRGPCSCLFSDRKDIIRKYQTNVEVQKGNKGIKGHSNYSQRLPF